MLPTLEKVKNEVNKKSWHVVIDDIKMFELRTLIESLSLNENGSTLITNRYYLDWLTSWDLMKKGKSLRILASR